MNISKVQEYFDENIPTLNFLLAGQSAVSVNVATINTAKRLATSFQDYVHPDVLKFLELVAYTPEDELGEASKSVIASKSYARFCFYLTVFCGRLELMLEMHAVQYLPKIGIPLSMVVDMEYYPWMKDDHMDINKHGVIFGGNIDSLLLFCHSMKDNYIRVNLTTDYKDISAVDILGYVERIA